MVEGPRPKEISATDLSGTVPPDAVRTGRFSRVVRSLRELSSRLTRIGTCRSAKENFAAFCGRSPSVAMRMV